MLAEFADVIAGSVIRVELLPGPRVFDLVVAAVIFPLGIWLALTRPARGDEQDRRVRLIRAPVLLLLAAAVGCVGGIYGLGGGSILAPILIGTGRRPSEVAPAALPGAVRERARVGAWAGAGVLATVPLPACPGRAPRPGGLGHFKVACREPGCPSVWYDPPHEPGARA